MRWGFRCRDKRLLINARAETLEARFKNEFYGKRCAVSVRGFYEWSHEKQRFYFTDKSGEGLTLCALWRDETEPEKTIEQIGFFDGDGKPECENKFVIITTAANPDVRPVHERMPLMVSGGNVEEWLYDDGYARRLLSARMPSLSVYP